VTDKEQYVYDLLNENQFRQNTIKFSINDLIQLTPKNKKIISIDKYLKSLQSTRSMTESINN